MTKINWDKYADVPQKVSINYGEEIVDYRIQQRWPTPPKFVVKACIANGFISRRQNPHQAFTIQEARDEALRCAEAGATSIHLHALADGKATGDVGLYHELVDPIKARYGRKLVYDGSVASGKTMEDAMLPVIEGIVEVAVVKPGAVFIGEKLSAWNPKWVMAQTELIEACGARPLITVHDSGYIENAKHWLIDTGIVRKPTHWMIATGMPGCSVTWNPRAAAKSLIFFTERILEVDPDAVITVGGGGRAHHHLTALAVAFGLHGVRVGKEDALYSHAHSDDINEDSSEIVRSTVALAREMGREVATGDEYRQMIGLS